MQSRFDFRSPLTLALTGLTLYVVFGALWWVNVYMGPHKVFNDMLVNNLVTSSVTKNEFITSNNQTTVQRVNVQLGAQNLVRSLSAIRSAAGNASTETIATPDTAYIRYVGISQSSGQRNYKNVLNVWAKTGTDSQSAALSKLFHQTMLDISVAPVPPLGYVNSAQRADLLAYAKDEHVFTPDYSQVKKGVVNGRRVYEYPVAVKLAPYLRMMQQFGHIYGLKDLDSLSPSDYQSADPVTITIAVDRLSHQMVRVSQATSGFNETYTDYGIERHLSVPTHAITLQELRNRFNKLQ